MNSLARVFYAFTGVITAVPTMALGGIEYFNIYSAFLLFIGLMFMTAALVCKE